MQLRLVQLDGDFCKINVCDVGSQRFEQIALIGVALDHFVSLVEHLAIAGIGLALGTWAGFEISRLMVSSVAVTETGNPVMPPFILTTDWGMMVPTYGVLLVIFLAAHSAVSAWALPSSLAFLLTG